MGVYHIPKHVCLALIALIVLGVSLVQIQASTSGPSLEKSVSSHAKNEISNNVEEYDFVEMGRLRAKFESILSSELSSMNLDEKFATKRPAAPLQNEHGRMVPDQTSLSGMTMKETGPADAKVEHEVIFQVRQLNKHLLLPKLLEVSSPRMERPHYTRDEVGKLTSNPTATSAVENFLKAHGDRIIKYDLGPYGEYIRATATVETWSELLNANFRSFEISYDYFENVVMEAPKKLIRALSYSLPTFLVEHVEVVRNTVQILPRRTLVPKPYDDPLEYVGEDSEGQTNLRSSKHAQKKKNGQSDCPVGTFFSRRTGECKNDVVTPDSLNTAYGIPNNEGGVKKASQGILSMIDDNVSPADLETFSNRFGKLKKSTFHSQIVLTPMNVCFCSPKFLLTHS